MSDDIHINSVQTVQTGPKKRIDYLDIVKGIGIILVVWAHAYGTFSSYIYQFHMPLFFLVSGYLYSDKRDVKTFTISKIKSLYIPFVACNILGIIVKGLLGLGKLTSKKQYILVLLTLDKDGAFFGAIWFLGALFVVSVVYRIIDYLLSEYKHRYIVMLFLFGMIALCGFEHTFKYKLSRTMILSFFFAAGHMIKQAHFPDIGMKKKGICAILAFLLFVFLARGNKASMSSNTYTYPVAFILESFLATYCIVVISQFIEAVRVLKPLKKGLMYLGKNSIDIVIWQFVAFKLVIALQLHIYNKPLSTIMDYYPCYYTKGIWMYVYTVVGVAGSILIGLVLRCIGRGVKQVINVIKH